MARDHKRVEFSTLYEISKILGHENVRTTEGYLAGFEQQAFDALFRRLPSLVGFSVQEARTLSGDRAAGVLERELVLADVESNPWPAQSQELFGEIVVALLDLMDAEPAARALLLGRTFARSLH